MDITLKQIYTPSDGYILDYVLPTSIIFGIIIVIIHLYIKAELGESKTNWEINKCVPKYMFVSGFIKKNPDSNELSSTYDNFKKCVREYKDTSYTIMKQHNINFNIADFFIRQ
jgi:hypothetical protein